MGRKPGRIWEGFHSLSARAFLLGLILFPLLCVKDLPCQEKKILPLSELLEKAAKAEPSEALPYLRMARERWGETKRLAPWEERALARRWLRILEEKAKKPEEVREVAGPTQPERIQRQILYHRFVEQRTFGLPLRFLLETEVEQGRDARIRRFLLPPP